MEDPEIAGTVAASGSGAFAGMRTLAEFASGEPETAAAGHGPAHFDGRPGYRDDFLPGFRVLLPDLGPNLANATQRTDRPGAFVLDYQHFSIAMSRPRRLAFYTAVNIAGGALRDVPRSRDRWFYDERIPVESQCGNELYRGNNLDRGHLVRRQDPNWGDDARTANGDTFHWTNCSPQHNELNPREWNELEDYILDNARARDLRLSVFTGPVFHPADPVYRGVALPQRFWKVVALSSEGRRSATAYMLSQSDMLGDLEFVFGGFKTYQVSIRTVENLTGLTFPASSGDDPLRNYDGFSAQENVAGKPVRARIDSWRDIRI